MSSSSRAPPVPRWSRPNSPPCRAFRGVAAGATETALTVSEPHVAIPALLALLQARHRDLLRLTTRHVSLEDVFVHLTGRHLRDDDEPPA